MAVFTTDALPKYDSEDLKTTVKRLHDYAVSLSEQLRFLLANLDEDNVPGLSVLGEQLSDAKGNLAELNLTAAGLTSRVENAEGSLTALSQTAEGLGARVESAEGSVATLSQTAAGLATRVTTAEGNISSVQQTASGLSSTVSSHTSSISTLTQTASSLTSRVSTAEGNITSVKQTASGLSSSVSDLSGKYSSLKQTVDGFDVAGQVRQQLENGVPEVVFKRGSTTLGYIDYDSDRAMRFCGENGITLDGGDADKVTIDGDTEIYGDCRIYLSATRWWEFTRTGIYYHSGSSTSVTVMQSA